MTHYAERDSMRYLVELVMVLLWTVSVQGMEWRESPEVAAVFAAADAANGTFVLYDVEDGTYVGYNRERAETRYAPASTFKIANALIGLATGVVKDVDTILPYGGAPQPVKEWERDMGLGEAIAMSNVPIYQELARRIGLEPMREYLGRIEYGNADPGAVVDRFWLDGPLAISAVEQTGFLARLAQDALPLPKEAQAAVRGIVRLEGGDDWELFGKTGAAMKYSPALGWWVGWVRKGGRLYTFALNLDMAGPNDFGKRMAVGKAALVALGIL